MTDGHVEGIEAAFAKAEADGDSALRAATSVVKALKAFHGAARQGKVRELNAAVEAARQGLTTLDQEVAKLSTAWTFDEERYLQDGEFSRELIERGRQEGLRIAELDNRLYCYPALIRILPGDRAVMIDKSRERRLRPSVLVRLLRDLQRRQPRFKPGEFLESLYAAYSVAITRKAGRAHGTVIPLVELYELLTMLPGQAREYARQEFARDVYLLDQSGQIATRSGATIEFHAGAGARLPKGALSIVTQQGAEKKYQGISFVAPPSR
jgi:hypothetical protein